MIQYIYLMKVKTSPILTEKLCFRPDTMKVKGKDGRLLGSLKNPRIIYWLIYFVASHHEIFTEITGKARFMTSHYGSNDGFYTPKQFTSPVVSENL